MHNVVIDKPYDFVPPNPSTFWPRLLRLMALPRVLKSQGIESREVIGLDRLRRSVDAGHGVLIAPNHCRPVDPMVVGPIGLEVGHPVHVMASWHLFMQGSVQRWLMTHSGAFSIYREGMDREALKCAIQILTAGRRPLVLFPEGVVSRTNDRLLHLMDGTVFIARNAAKQRAEQSPAGQVVIHPVAVRYFFLGDLQKSVTPVLDEIERRLTWLPRPGVPIEDRIASIGGALLGLKELEYAGSPQPGTLTERITNLIDRILVPLETEWLKSKRESDIIGRVKALRTAMLPDMIADKIDEAERARRWKQLADVYLAQQLSNYPPDYFTDHTPPERILETVERFEEDLTDTVRVHRPIHAAIEIGEAIPVPPGRDRGATSDPIMAQLRRDLETMLERLRARRPGRAAS